ncbi:MAG TPA: CHAT domain-containing protein, partial [Thermoanaerobaculia bacterium]|nr:CHAT domain-containing protein [Thermoanaerobaculia bacterium]
AVHGIYDPKGIQNGLILIDKQVLHPLYVKGTDLGRVPFVFLNACQVGTGHEILGDYAGLAEAFLYAGASGVIAPLWSVKDETAKQIALDFYREIEAGGSPASFIRAERAKFKDSPETVSATYLAYQFFGHPRLKLVGLRSQEGGDS